MIPAAGTCPRQWRGSSGSSGNGRSAGEDTIPGRAPEFPTKPRRKRRRHCRALHPIAPPHPEVQGSVPQRRKQQLAPRRGAAPRHGLGCTCHASLSGAPARNSIACKPVGNQRHAVIPYETKSHTWHSADATKGPSYACDVHFKPAGISSLPHLRSVKRIIDG
jgi:hypothetical protein